MRRISLKREAGVVGTTECLAVEYLAVFKRISFDHYFPTTYVLIRCGLHAIPGWTYTRDAFILRKKTWFSRVVVQLHEDIASILRVTSFPWYRENLNVYRSSCVSRRRAKERSFRTMIECNCHPLGTFTQTDTTIMDGDIWHQLESTPCIHWEIRSSNIYNINVLLNFSVWRIPF